MNDGSPIADVVARMQQRLDDLPPELAHRRFFLGTYLRTTAAVGRAIDQACFEDPDWVEVWDVKFAELYLQAHDGDLVARPWRLAFEAPPTLPGIAHVLLGINAHINYDLPQALLAVIAPEDFENAHLMERRRRDHERIDHVLAERVAAEDGELEKAGPTRTPLDRLMTPLNQAASRRFLKEARVKVWHNTLALHEARLQGDDAYRRRLGDLEVLSAAKVNALLRPGAVLVRLALVGFGVTVPPD